MEGGCGFIPYPPLFFRAIFNAKSVLRFISIPHLISVSPLLPVCLCVMAGISVSPYIYDYVGIVPLALLLSGVSLISLYVGRYKTSQTLYLLMAYVLAGIILYGIAMKRTSVDITGKAETYSAVVYSRPVSGIRSVSFDVVVLTGALEGKKIRVFIPKSFFSNGGGHEKTATATVCDTLAHADVATGMSGNIFRISDGILKIGDCVEITSAFIILNSSRGSKFDYSVYLRSRNILAVTYVKPWEIKHFETDTGSLSLFDKVMLCFGQWRQNLSDMYSDKDISGQEGAVVAAMTLGDKSFISSDTRKAYSISGAAHVLALSGLHLGIIYAFFSFLLFRNSRLCEVLAVGFIWVYVLLVGFSPSVVRAAIMISVCSFGVITGRDYLSLNSLAFAALIMLVANPLNMWDIGFQLSFTAVGFIVTFGRQAIEWFSPKFRMQYRILSSLWSFAAITIVAQLATVPLVAYYFGGIPLYFMVTNIVAIPLTTLILYLSAGFVFIPPVRDILAAVIMYIATLMNEILNGIASLPYSSISVGNISVFQTAMLYVIVICFLVVVNIVMSKIICSGVS